MKAKTIFTIVLSILLSAEIIMILICIALYIILSFYQSIKGIEFICSIASIPLRYSFITIPLAVAFLPLCAYWLYEKTIAIKTGRFVVVVCFLQFILVPLAWLLLFRWDLTNI